MSLSSKANSNDIYKESQRHMNKDGVISMKYEIKKGNAEPQLYTLSEMNNNFYETTDEFYKNIAKFKFLANNILYANICQEARVLQQNEIFESYINEYFDQHFVKCLHNYYKFSPAFFKTLFPVNKDYIPLNARNIHQSFQKYYYLLCIIEYTNKNKDSEEMKNLPLNFYNNIVTWCLTRNDPNIEYQINGPNKNQSVTFNFQDHYNSLISIQNTTQKINDYNKLVKLETMNNNIYKLLMELMRRNNVYDKTPDLAREYIYNLDTKFLHQKYVNTNNRLIFDLAYSDFGDTTNNTTRAKLEDIDKLQTTDITLSKLNIKKLEQLFNMYSRVKISSLIVNKNTYIVKLSQLPLVYVVFEGIQCSDRTVGNNKHVANGDLAIPGYFIENEQGNYEFRPRSEYTTYRPTRTRVSKCNLYITTFDDTTATNNIIPYAIDLDVTRNSFYNIPLKIVGLNRILPENSRLNILKQYPDLLFNDISSFEKSAYRHINKQNKNNNIISQNVGDNNLNDDDIINNTDIGITQFGTNGTGDPYLNTYYGETLQQITSTSKNQTQDTSNDSTVTKSRRSIVRNKNKSSNNYNGSGVKGSDSNYSGGISGVCGGNSSTLVKRDSTKLATDNSGNYKNTNVGGVFLTMHETVDNKISTNDLTLFYDFDTKLINFRTLINGLPEQTNSNGLPIAGDDMNTFIYKLFMDNWVFTNKQYLINCYGNYVTEITSLDDFKNNLQVFNDPMISNIIVNNDDGTTTFGETNYYIKNDISKARYTVDVPMFDDLLLTIDNKTNDRKNSLNFYYDIYGDLNENLGCIINYVLIHIPLTNYHIKLFYNCDATIIDENGEVVVNIVNGHTYTNTDTDTRLDDYNSVVKIKYTFTRSKKSLYYYDVCTIVINDVYEYNINLPFKLLFNHIYTCFGVAAVPRVLTYDENDEVDLSDYYIKDLGESYLSTLTNINISDYLDEDGTIGTTDNYLSLLRNIVENNKTSLSFELCINTFSNNFIEQNNQRYINLYYIKDYKLNQLNSNNEIIGYLPLGFVNGNNSVRICYEASQLFMFMRQTDNITTTAAKLTTQQDFLYWSYGTDDENEERIAYIREYITYIGNRYINGDVYFNSLRSNDILMYNFNTTILNNNISLIDLSDTIEKYTDNEHVMFSNINDYDADNDTSYNLHIENCYYSVDDEDDKTYAEDLTIYFNNIQNQLSYDETNELNANNTQNISQADSIKVYESNKYEVNNIYTIQRSFIYDNIENTGFENNEIVISDSITYNTSGNVEKIINYETYQLLTSLVSIDNVTLTTMTFIILEYIAQLINKIIKDGNVTEGFLLKLPSLIDIQGISINNQNETDYGTPSNILEYLIYNNINTYLNDYIDNYGYCPMEVRILATNFDVYVEPNNENGQTKITYIIYHVPDMLHKLDNTQYEIETSTFYKDYVLKYINTNDFAIMNTYEYVEDGITYNISNMSLIYTNKTYQTLDIHDLQLMINTEIIKLQDLNISIEIPVSITYITLAKARKYITEEQNNGKYILKEYYVYTVKPENDYNVINYYNNTSLLNLDVNTSYSVEYLKRLIYYFKMYYNYKSKNIPTFIENSVLSKHDSLSIMNRNTAQFTTEQPAENNYMLDLLSKNIYEILNTNFNENPETYNINNNAVNIVLNKSDLEITLVWN